MDNLENLLKILINNPNSSKQAPTQKLYPDEAFPSGNSVQQPNLATLLTLLSKNSKHTSSSILENPEILSTLPNANLLTELLNSFTNKKPKKDANKQNDREQKAPQIELI